MKKNSHTRFRVWLFLFLRLKSDQISYDNYFFRLLPSEKLYNKDLQISAFSITELLQNRVAF